MAQQRRRQHGTGSVYPIAGGKWRGSFDAGYTASGNRRRITVTGGTKAEAKRRLERRIAEVKRGGAAATGKQHTVKTWADEWLEITEHTLAPKTWSTNRGQVMRWIVPAIGRVRLADLTHADVRAVASRQRAAKPKPQSPASISRTKSVLMKMLKDAVADGHYVPQPVVAVQPKRARKGGNRKDREGLPLEDALACVDYARRTLPHASRWQVAFLQGLRQGEALGLTWDRVDLDAGLLTVSWQLQPVPYRDKRDRSQGFRLPDDAEVRHLWKSFHLVLPKTEAGERVIPLVPWAVDALREWRDVAPENPHNLVWTRPDGKPIDKLADLNEWKAIQNAVKVQHRAGRPYGTHEIRYTTATILVEAEVDPIIITAILGHTNFSTTRGYVTKRAQQARPAMEAVARALGMLSPADTP